MRREENLWSMHCDEIVKKNWNLFGILHENNANGKPNNVSFNLKLVSLGLLESWK